jgi:hypothetical protein
MRQVLLELPDDVYERAVCMAELATERVESYLARCLQDVFDGRERFWGHLDLSGLDDKVLLATVAATASTGIQDQLDQLRALNSARQLTRAEQSEYERLIRVAHTGTMLRARALLAWKVRHGCLPPGFDAFEKPANLASAPLESVAGEARGEPHRLA